MDEAGEWSPREDFNLHYRVRSPVVCALAYEGMAVARGIEPRPRASEARVISVSPGDGGRGTGARTQTDGLKGRRAAVTACPRNGATRECRTPSRCVQGSYAPERWWRGDQPWDRTTFSRASAERYDHTSSLVAGVEPTAGVEPAPARYEGAVPPATLRRPRSRLEDSNPDSPVIGRTSCLLDEAWVGPAGWSRTSLGPLKRRVHGRSATTGYDGWL